MRSWRPALGDFEASTMASRSPPHRGSTRSISSRGEVRGLADAAGSCRSSRRARCGRYRAGRRWRLQIPAVGAQGREQLFLRHLGAGGRLAGAPAARGGAAGIGARRHAASARAGGAARQEALEPGADLQPRRLAAGDDELARRVAELAHVARPVVAGQAGDQGGRQPGRGRRRRVGRAGRSSPTRRSSWRRKWTSSRPMSSRRSRSGGSRIS